MTATLHRIHDVCAAEAHEAEAMRVIKQTRRHNRTIAGYMAIIFAALIGAVQLESAVTAMIAADLAE